MQFYGAASYDSLHLLAGHQSTMIEQRYILCFLESSVHRSRVSTFHNQLGKGKYITRILQRVKPSFNVDVGLPKDQ